MKREERERGGEGGSSFGSLQPEAKPKFCSDLQRGEKKSENAKNGSCLEREGGEERGREGD